MKRARETAPSLSTDERRLVDRIAQHYRPHPMTPARQAAFRQQLERRRARGRCRAWGVAYAATLVAAAVVLVWLRVPPQPSEHARTHRLRRDSTLRALIDPDAYETESAGLLPEEYLVLARVLDVPLEDL